MVSVLKEDKQIQRHKKEGHVKMETEMGKTQLQAKECLVAGNHMVERKRVFSYSIFKGNPGGHSLKIRDFFYVLSHLLYGNLLWDPKGKNINIKIKR